LLVALPAVVLELLQQPPIKRVDHFPASLIRIIYPEYSQLPNIYT